MGILRRTLMLSSLCTLMSLLLWNLEEVFGSFNTENQEVLKLLTTTFEYGKMRQILQKKSVQMLFTTEQMR
jgi:hypothetical protein